MSESTYFRYWKKWSAKDIRCPSCMERFTLRQYVEDHFPNGHGMTLKQTCVFCLGGKCWAKCKRNYKHIVPCMKRFMEENAVRCSVEVEKDPEMEEMVPICMECKHFKSEPRQLFGRTMDPLSEYVSFYDSMFERPEEYSSSPITFSEQSGLGADVYGMVQRYLKNDLKWYHLMVKYDNFHNFVNAMEKVKDEIFLLPFWCLCDGGEKHVMHRHMILAHDTGLKFEKIWKEEVRYDFVNGGKGKWGHCIEDAWHFVRVIQYVSQRKASCDGTRIKDEVVGNNFTYSHFYMNRPLHEHAIVVMSTFFKGGMEQLLMEQNKRKNVVNWLPHVKEIRSANYNVRYSVPIKVTGFKFQNCMLPLNWDLEPTEEETELHLWWLGGKKLYLRANPSLLTLTSEEWYAHQVAKGNTVWCIRNELYVLGLSQQNVMRQIKITQKRTKETEKSRWEKQYSELEMKNERLECENRSLKEMVEKERTEKEFWMKKARETEEKLEMLKGEECMHIWPKDIDMELNE